MKQLVRFSFAGLANTILGYILILLALHYGVHDYFANVIGYIAGIMLGYFLNKRFVFEDKISEKKDRFLRYIIAVACSYSLNLGVVSIGLALGFNGSPMVHLVAMVFYSATLFILSKYFVFTDDIESQCEKYVSLIIAILLTVPMVIVFALIPVTNDVVWQFWIAKQMLGGSELYVQINEVNPPLWFWMAMPIQWIADNIGIQSIGLNNVFMVLLTGIVSVISAYLLPKEAKNSQAIFVVTVIIISYIAALQNFAQREHLTMLVTLPYAMLVCQRVANISVNFWLALFIGLLASVGFALKHYFIIVPIILELYVLYKKQHVLESFRPETVALAVCAITYIVAIFIVSPGFFEIQLPINLAFYNSFGRDPIFSIRTLFNNIQPLMWSIFLVVFILNRWHPFKKDNPFYPVLFLTACGFFIVYIIQWKGFSYHAIPVSFFILLLFTQHLLSENFSERSFIQNTVTIVVTLLLLVVCLLIGPYKNDFRAYFEAALQDVPKGSTVYVLVNNPGRIWPMIDDMGYIWPSRFYSLWTSVGMLHKDGTNPKIQKLSTEIKEMMIQDLECNPPQVILVPKFTDINKFTKFHDAKILDIFLDYKPAKNFFKNYTFSFETHIKHFEKYNFSVYKLNRDHSIVPRDKTVCRKIY